MSKGESKLPPSLPVIYFTFYRAKSVQTDTLCFPYLSLVPPGMLSINMGYSPVYNVRELRVRQIDQQIKYEYKVREIDRKSSVLQPRPLDDMPSGVGGKSEHLGQQSRYGDAQQQSYEDPIERGACDRSFFAVLPVNDGLDAPEDQHLSLIHI